MLKYIRGFILIATVLLVSACVSPTHAASAPIVISQIQAGGVGAALQELVVIFNNSLDEVDLTNWCLRNKSNVDFVCFTPTTQNERLILPARGFATIGSTAIISGTVTTTFTLTYTVTNQSSGSIIGSADTISLVDADKMVVDSHSWTSSITGGMSFYRRLAGVEPTEFIDTDQATDWNIQTTLPIPDDQIIYRLIEGDECQESECDESVETPTLLPLRITELLPNPEGSDTGKEFIELYNPNEVDVPLSDYTLWYGPEFQKSLAFPDAAVVPGMSYVIFSNTDFKYSLLNSSSRVRITDGDDNIVDETPVYNDPDDGSAWALIGEEWQYTNHPTPGLDNVASDIIIQVDEVESSTQKPCAANQYRSPETNRCRLIASTTKTVAPCKDNQYRSEETNRCRNIVTNTIAACKEGQERNPDTNRCRNSVKVSNADYAVLGEKTSNDNKWYVWVAIAIVLVLALAYSVWEWRFELRKLFLKMRTLVRIRK